MSARKKHGDHEAPNTRARSNTVQSQGPIPKGSAAGQRTETPTIEADNTLDLAIETRIKEALCSEDVLKALVAAVKEAILEQVTQQVYAAVKMDMVEHENKLVSLETQVSYFKRELSNVNTLLEEHEQHSRRNSLRFYGVNETQGIDTDKLICDIAKENLSIDITERDIDRSHRVMPKPNNNSTGGGQQRGKSIIVKFATYNIRQKVYQARSKLKGTKIFINEDLTSHRQDLMYAARKSEAIVWTWSQDGKIFALTSGVGAEKKRIVIRSRSDIDRLG